MHIHNAQAHVLPLTAYIPFAVAVEIFMVHVEQRTPVQQHTI